MNTLTDNYLLPLVAPPVQRWQHKAFDKAGILVDVLRLDLIHPVIGGNKWMKLKGFMADALAGGKAGILTKGGPWSNHLYAGAWLCNELKLQCHIWVKGHNGLINPMLADIAKWNAVITYTNRTVFYDETIAAKTATENNLLYIPMGGAEETGVEHVSEYLRQLLLPTYQYAICAVGTATTFGGMAFMQDNFSHVVGIDAGTGDNAVKQKIAAWQQLLPHKVLSLISGYHFGGFARHTAELTNFMNELYASHYLPTDIVYTGKLLYAVMKLAEMQYFTPGTKLLIIHSGGLQGNRSLPAGSLQF